jgi:hypothetical protein
MPTSGSRAEFLAVDELGAANGIKYGRTGGWFVSTKKAILLGLLVILAMVLVGVLVYYLASWKGGKLVKLLCLSNELKQISFRRLVDKHTSRDTNILYYCTLYKIHKCRFSFSTLNFRVRIYVPAVLNLCMYGKIRCLHHQESIFFGTCM